MDIHGLVTWPMAVWAQGEIVQSNLNQAILIQRYHGFLGGIMASTWNLWRWGERLPGRVRMVGARFFSLRCLALLGGSSVSTGRRLFHFSSTCWGKKIVGLYCTLCVLVQGMYEIKRPLCPAHNSIQWSLRFGRSGDKPVDASEFRRSPPRRYKTSEKTMG